MKRLGSDAATREITTPEGVPLSFEIATFGSRVVAFLVDVLVIALVGILVVSGIVLGGAVLGFGGSSVLGAIIVALGVVFWFFLWNFGIIVQEIQWQGRTIGKRMMRIRTVDRYGRELDGIRICARNFSREIELWLPLKMLLGAGAVFGDLPGWAIPLCVLWALLVPLIPLTNRERLRLGDLIGGTVVVVEPRTRLLPDLVAPDAKKSEVVQASFAFTREQLEIYGIYELQILEDLLRRARVDDETLDVVAEKIKVKIDWPQGQWSVPTRPFLEDFYRAQRERLEKKALLGRRQDFKRDYEG